MPLNMSALLQLTTQPSVKMMKDGGNGGSGQYPPISEEKLAQEIEHGSILLLRQFIVRCIEAFGLLKILDEHKFHFISNTLDKQVIEI